MNDAMKNAWYQHLNELKFMHNSIAESMPRNKIAYIDIPLHYNTGDLLIYLGTEEFFKINKIDIEYRALQNGADFKKLNECDTIIVHGGGNFGDVYQCHHDNRMKLLLKLKNKKIIFMPQSVHFEKKSNLDNTKEIMDSFHNVTMYVRDNHSFEVAKNLLENVIMMPDMAHSLHPLVTIDELRNIRNKSLNLIRVDIEKVEQKRAINKKSFDWWDLVDGNDNLLKGAIKRAQKINYLGPKLVKLWNVQATSNVTKATAFVDSYDCVYTDRLHGFILGWLLGKETISYDNVYGKIERYKEAWLKHDYLIRYENE